MRHEIPRLEVQADGKGPATRRLLEVVGLSKAFGAIIAVDAVTLSVEPGARLGIIGPNGAGKTTLFQLITGKERPTAGEIFFNGRRITRMPRRRRARLGLGRTFQILTLFPSLSPYEHFLLAARTDIRRTAGPERAEQTLAALGLTDVARAPVSVLSYGQQRLVELGMTLCSNATLLLLDEPAAGLGPADREMLRERIRDLPGELTVILVEHDIELVLDTVDRVVCLSDGRMVADGTPEHIRNDPVVQEVYLGRAEQPHGKQ
jgi:branched-chain amino acid transport system ATP-binding protein